MLWLIFNIVDVFDVHKFIRQWDLIPLFIIVSYLSFVLLIGPNIMRNKKPYDISKIIVWYNIIQIIFNVYLGYQTVHYIYNYVKLNELHCIREERPGSSMYRTMKEIQLLCVLNKLMDLLDTVFFVLRKKQTNVSFLHVYHHSMVFLGSWFLFKHIAGGSILLFGAINSFVHVAMYSYYLLCLSPSLVKLAKYMKKPLTQAQIIQFVIIGLQGFLFFLDDNCEEHDSIQYYFGIFGLTQIALMLILFSNFYRRTYVMSSYSRTANLLHSKTE